MTKLELSKILDKDYDGRSVSGLEKAIARKQLSGKEMQEVSVMKNLLKVVKMCEHLVASVASMDAGELLQCLSILEQEEIQPPVSFQKQLLARKAQELRLGEQFVELMRVMNPFSENDGFNMYKPMLCCIAVDEQQKVRTYNETIMEQLVLQWIAEGEKSSQKLLQFARHALGLMEGVDLVEIADYYRAKELGEHMVIWRSIVAILGDELDVGKQDLLRGWVSPEKQHWLNPKLGKSSYTDSTKNPKDPGVCAQPDLFGDSVWAAIKKKKRVLFERKT